MGGAGPPSFTLSTITSKVVVYIQLKGQIHSPYFFSTPICTLCLCLTCVTRIFLCVLARPLNFFKIFGVKTHLFPDSCYSATPVDFHLTVRRVTNSFFFEEDKNDLQYCVGGSVADREP